ncbi:MAG: hypothetical protein M1825_004254 [Sarcosagium campestre]|nr:MAG: hypothetical protein M1825_004254 [Sarcosagium campestre]
MPHPNTNGDILLAGALAAFSVDLLVYPLDTLKTRLQSPDYRKIYTSPTTGAIRRSVLFRGLYQGIGSVIIATLPSSGAFFTTYEGVKSLLEHHNPRIRRDGSNKPLIPLPLLHAISSATAELVSCFILTPAEVIKQNAQMIQRPSSTPTSGPTSTPSPNATLAALRRFKRPTQLWRGYTALAARNLPFTALQFPLFEKLKITLTKRWCGDESQSKSASTSTSSTTSSSSSSSQPPPSLPVRGLVTAVSAGASGALAAVLTTPVDVIKTRIMLAAASESSEPGSNTDTKRVRGRDRPGAWSVGAQILKHEGFKALWRGGALRGVWTALGSGLYLGTYESGRVYLGDRRESRRNGDSLV